MEMNAQYIIALLIMLGVAIYGSYLYATIVVEEKKALARLEKVEVNTKKLFKRSFIKFFAILLGIIILSLLDYI